MRPTRGEMVEDMKRALEGQLALIEEFAQGAKGSPPISGSIFDQVCSHAASGAELLVGLGVREDDDLIQRASKVVAEHCG